MTPKLGPDLVAELLPDEAAGRKQLGAVGGQQLQALADHLAERLGNTLGAGVEPSRRDAPADLADEERVAAGPFVHNVRGVGRWRQVGDGAEQRLHGGTIERAERDAERAVSLQFGERAGKRVLA